MVLFFAIEGLLYELAKDGATNQQRSEARDEARVYLQNKEDDKIPHAVKCRLLYLLDPALQDEGKKVNLTGKGILALIRSEIFSLEDAAKLAFKGRDPKSIEDPTLRDVAKKLNPTLELCGALLERGIPNLNREWIQRLRSKFGSVGLLQITLWKKVETALKGKEAANRMERRQVQELYASSDFNKNVPVIRQQLLDKGVDMAVADALMEIDVFESDDISEEAISKVKELGVPIDSKLRSMVKRTQEEEDEIAASKALEEQNKKKTEAEAEAVEANRKEEAKAGEAKRKEEEAAEALKNEAALKKTESMRKAQVEATKAEIERAEKKLSDLKLVYNEDALKEKMKDTKLAEPKNWKTTGASTAADTFLGKAENNELACGGSGTENTVITSYASQKELVSCASGGRALHGIAFFSDPDLMSIASVPSAPILQIPDEVEVKGTLGSFEARIFKTTSVNEANGFTNTVVSTGTSIAESSSSSSGRGVSGSGIYHGVALSANAQESVTSSSKSNKDSTESSTDQRESKSMTKTASVIEYVKCPMRSFRFARPDMKLTSEAIQQARKVHSKFDAECFLDEFGTHVPSGRQVLGGVFLRKTTMTSNRAVSSEELMAEAGELASEESGKAAASSGSVGASVPGGLAGAAVSFDASKASKSGKRTFKATSNHSGNAQEEVSAYYETTVNSIGPIASNVVDFQKSLMTNTGSWALIDRGPIEAQVPVWELLEDHAAKLEAVARIKADSNSSRSSAVAAPQAIITSSGVSLEGAVSVWSTAKRDRIKRALWELALRKNALEGFGTMKAKTEKVLSPTLADDLKRCAGLLRSAWEYRARSWETVLAIYGPTSLRTFVARSFSVKGTAQQLTKLLSQCMLAPFEAEKKVTLDVDQKKKLVDEHVAKIVETVRFCFGEMKTANTFGNVCIGKMFLGLVRKRGRELIDMDDAANETMLHEIRALCRRLSAEGWDVALEDFETAGVEALRERFLHGSDEDHPIVRLDANSHLAIAIVETNQQLASFSDDAAKINSLLGWYDKEVPAGGPDSPQLILINEHIRKLQSVAVCKGLPEPRNLPKPPVPGSDSSRRSHRSYLEKLEEWAGVPSAVNYVVAAAKNDLPAAKSSTEWCLRSIKKHDAGRDLKNKDKVFLDNVVDGFRIPRANYRGLQPKDNFRARVGESGWVETVPLMAAKMDENSEWTIELVERNDGYKISNNAKIRVGDKFHLIGSTGEALRVTHPKSGGPRRGTVARQPGEFGALFSFQVSNCGHDHDHGEDPLRRQSKILAVHSHSPSHSPSHRHSVPTGKSPIQQTTPAAVEPPVAKKTPVPEAIDLQAAAGAVPYEEDSAPGLDATERSASESTTEHHDVSLRSLEVQQTTKDFTAQKEEEERIMAKVVQDARGKNGSHSRPHCYICIKNDLGVTLHSSPIKGVDMGDWDNNDHNSEIGPNETVLVRHGACGLYKGCGAYFGYETSTNPKISFLIGFEHPYSGGDNHKWGLKIIEESNKREIPSFETMKKMVCQQKDSNQAGKKIELPSRKNNVKMMGEMAGTKGGGPSRAYAVLITLQDRDYRWNDAANPK